MCSDEGVAIEEMSRFIEELHSLFFCDAWVYDAQNTYQPL